MADEESEIDQIANSEQACVCVCVCRGHPIGNFEISEILESSKYVIR
jgi:hypothetical protein